MEQGIPTKEALAADLKAYQEELLKKYGPAVNEMMHHGIKGMKWGIRNGQGAATAAAHQPEPAPANESSTQRYDRLLSQAKKSGGNSLTDEELKFVQNRGNAIAAVNRLNEQKPNWLADASSQVLKNVAKQTMQAIVAKGAKDYITAPLTGK